MEKYLRYSSSQEGMFWLLVTDSAVAWPCYFLAPDEDGGEGVVGKKSVHLVVAKTWTKRRRGSGSSGPV